MEVVAGRPAHESTVLFVLQHPLAGSRRSNTGWASTTKALAALDAVMRASPLQRVTSPSTYVRHREVLSSAAILGAHLALPKARHWARPVTAFQ